MKVRNYLLILLSTIIYSCATKKDGPTPTPFKTDPVINDTTKVLPTLTDFGINPKTFGDADFIITAPKSNSTGAFIYTSSNLLVAQTDGNKIIVKGSGTTVITASQAASGNFAAASITASFNVAPKQTITGKFNAPVFLSGITYHIVAPVSNNPSKFVFSSGNPLVAKVSNDTLKVVGIGQVFIIARQEATTGYSTVADTLVLTSAVTPITKPITDADNNIYTAVTVGNQIWLGQNLVTTKYRDGSAITYSADDGITGWGALTAGAQTIYNNDPANKTYGRLYNWYATTNKIGLAPAGWHISEDEEWIALFTHFGGRDNTGPALRQSANNATDFNALLGGVYTRDLTTGKFTFNGLNKTSKFWIAGEFNSTLGLGTLLVENSLVGIESAPKQNAYSVRCLQDYVVTFK
ncbi:fibrobacter succinogenes major paralogous domain-containing protein [Mucilaginibacter gilvus]|uniref:Fibrobacter succinogenes major paralogous domain-containing protein n=1 Tax=Mucilaginibacter gilvus TaxID=2305909 RepID=A0A3S3UGU7_9SPHI|nr:fibrobacter succinogenes major paralogous domain-containing protein [Mucilaginibacter gilvus]RWY46040.1 hypothetical protein EPL05_23630 [Mucilaginibacter gilvus]